MTQIMTPALRSPRPLTLGKTIRKARIDRDIQLPQMAQRLDLSPRYLAEIEKDMHPVSSNVLKKIAEVLDIDPVEIYALAGKIDGKVLGYLKDVPAAAQLFHQIYQAKLDTKGLQDLQMHIQEFLKAY